MITDIDDLEQLDYRNITNLEIENCNIDNDEFINLLSECINLKSLEISSSRIISFNFLKEMKKLESLKISSIKTKSDTILDLTSNILLKEFDIARFYVFKIDLSNLSNLISCKITYQSFGSSLDINIEGCKSLEVLELYKVKVSKIATLNLLNLTNVEIILTNLQNFSCDSKLISTLYFKGNDSLEFISIPFAKFMYKFEVYKCISLNSININFNLELKEFILKDTELNNKNINTLDQIKAIKELNKDSDKRGWAAAIDSGLFDSK